MTTDEILSGIAKLGELVAMLPGPVAVYAGKGLQLSASAIRAAEMLSVPATDLLDELETALRRRVTADWQAALDKGAP
jgi:hypothetical protein